MHAGFLELFFFLQQKKEKCLVVKKYQNKKSLIIIIHSVCNVYVFTLINQNKAIKNGVPELWLEEVWNVEKAVEAVVVTVPVVRTVERRIRLEKLQ